MGASDTIMTAPLSVADTLAGRELLVTGFTGFLGKVLVAHLLYEVPALRRVHVLLRAPSRSAAEARFVAIAARSPAFRPLRERFGEDLGAFLGARVEVHKGDVRDPLLGLSRDAIAALAPRLSAVLHVAGLTDFAPDPRHALETNVEGALHAADLVARCEHARLIHTSTCFVAGVRQGVIPEEIVATTPLGRPWDPEAELAHLQALACHEAADDRLAARREARAVRIGAATARAELCGFINIQSYTKALAEALLVERCRANGQRRNVPLTIVRPAIVECALAFPFAGWNEGVDTTGPLLWLAKSWFRHLPMRADAHFDVVPVDAVTRAMMMITAAALTDRAEPVYQLGTSGSAPLTMDRAVELTNLAIRKELALSEHTHERRLKRFLDNVIVPADGEHALSPARLRRIARSVRSTLEGLNVQAMLPGPLRAAFGDRLGRLKDDAELFLEGGERQLRRIQKLLDQYRPLVHDNDWVFVNARVRRLDAALADDDERGRFGWIGDAIDWRRYWIDVLYPGIGKWCLPLLEGDEPPEDPPLPFELELVPPTDVPDDAVELDEGDDVDAIMSEDAGEHVREHDHAEHDHGEP